MYSINLLKSIFSMNQSGKKVLTKDLISKVVNQVEEKVKEIQNNN